MKRKGDELENDVVKRGRVKKDIVPVADVTLCFKNPSYSGRSANNNLPLAKIHEKIPFDPNTPTHKSIGAPPSLKPTKKYCDMTGLEAPYKDPRTGLRYADTEAFRQINTIISSQHQIQGYLQVRNAHNNVIK